MFRRKRMQSNLGAKQPPHPCPFCHGPTKRLRSGESEIGGQTILRCPKCNKIGTAKFNPPDWQDFSNPKVLSLGGRHYRRDQQILAGVRQPRGMDADWTV